MSTWESALDELARTRMHHLVAYALLLTGSRDKAQDLVQDALVSVFSSRAKLENRAVAEAYVRRAIASRFVDSTRTTKRERARFESLRITSEVVVAASDDTAILHTDIAKALQLLPAQERACVLLRHLEQLSTRETAAALKISEGAVKRYLADGIGRMKGLMGEQLTVSNTESIAVAERSMGNA